MGKRTQFSQLTKQFRILIIGKENIYIAIDGVTSHPNNLQKIQTLINKFSKCAERKIIAF